MKKFKLWGFFTIICSLFVLNNVNATCDYETQVKLATEAANVKIQYEAGNYGTGQFETSEIPDEDGNYKEYEITELKVIASIYNITESMYVKIVNNETKEENIYYYKDTNNGTLSWERKDVDKIVSYSIEIFSNNNDCLNDSLRKVELVTPKFNVFSQYDYCENVDKYYCQQFITTELNMTEEEIVSLTVKAKEEEKKEEESKEKANNNYIWWIVGSVIVVLGVATTVIIIKKRRSRVI